MEIVSIKFLGSAKSFAKSLKSLGIDVKIIDSCGHDYYRFTYIIPEENKGLQLSKLRRISAFVGDTVNIDKVSKLQIR